MRSEAPSGDGGAVVNDLADEEFLAQSRSSFEIERARLSGAGVKMGSDDVTFAIFHLGFCAGATFVSQLVKSEIK